VTWRASARAHGFDLPWAVTTDRVIWWEDGEVVARDPRTAATVWSTAIPRDGDAEIVARGNRVVCESDASTGGAAVTYVDAADGRVLRREALAGEKRLATAIEGHALVRARPLAGR